LHITSQTKPKENSSLGLPYNRELESKVHRVSDLKWMASSLPLVAPGAPPVSFLRLTIKISIRWWREKCVG